MISGGIAVGSTRNNRSAVLSMLLGLLLCGCASSPTPVPVIDRAPALKSESRAKQAARESDWRPKVYTVQKGDTLYGIALEYGFDYKEIAAWNDINSPYVIRIGQQLKLAAAEQGVIVTALKSEAPVETRTQDSLLKTQPKALKQPYPGDVQVKPEKAEPSKEPSPPAKAVEEKTAQPAEVEKTPVAEDDERVNWSWPASGKIITGFDETSSAKGVDIGGKSGQPVLAAAPGKVVYSGNGLRGYGKLVIVKHNKTYLSAYAHNRQILVKEGQNVAAGQKIAEMGDTDADQVKLHFEIRRLGKPVNPAKYLPTDKNS